MGENKETLKKKSLLATLEGLYMLLGYYEDKGNQDQDKRNNTCIIKDKGEWIWGRPKVDL
jgi:hypothetical protein